VPTAAPQTRLNLVGVELITHTYLLAAPPLHRTSYDACRKCSQRLWTMSQASFRVSGTACAIICRPSLVAACPDGAAELMCLSSYERSQQTLLSFVRHNFNPRCFLYVCGGRSLLPAGALLSHHRGLCAPAEAERGDVCRVCGDD
jgi:hypothetical protein